MDKLLMQEEIDALLNGSDSLLDMVEKYDEIEEELVISEEEADVLGEIGNISMGSAATTLSQLLNQRVIITSPKVKIFSQEELFNSFSIPYMAIEVDFTAGLQGLNLLIMKLSDASIISDMMMGGDGTNVKDALTDIEMSAAAEAMNQMIGSSATAMSQIFQTAINISPPRARTIEANIKDYRPFGASTNIVVVSFNMQIGELVDTEIMQIINVEIAKDKVKMLQTINNLEESDDIVAPLEEEPIPLIHQETDQPIYDLKREGPNQSLDKNYELILDIPLKVSVVLGKSKKTISEVLRLMPGSIVELDKILNEDVDILVNGTLVAKGEVVVVDESFGVRITTIITPAERINYIR